MSEDREAEMLVGYRTNDHDKPINLDSEGLLHHTLVVGQSGSGKSFFVARVIEEIILSTWARVLIIDPNGDFRSLSQASPPGFWSANKFVKRFAQLGRISGRDPNYDDQESFRTAWAGRTFLKRNAPCVQKPNTSEGLGVGAQPALFDALAVVRVDEAQVGVLVCEIESGCHLWLFAATIHGGPILLPGRKSP
jgi:hypothetical protein